MGNQETPLVSVIIPAYNNGEFIADAIKSVLAQTHGRIECIVVDDGSGDRTPDEVRRFGNRVRYLRQENRGVSSARNLGMNVAAGDYVSFLDGDDVWLPQKVELQMTLFKRRPELGAVYTGLHLTSREGDFTGREDPAPGDFALRNTLLLERPIMSIVTAVIPRHVVKTVGGFDENLSTSADCEFGCRIAMNYPVEAVAKPLVLYRRHESQMHSNPRLTERDMRMVFERLFEDPNLPSEIRPLKNRAYANLYVSLAGAYLRRGDKGRFLIFAARALLRRPDRVFDALRRVSAPKGGVTRAV